MNREARAPRRSAPRSRRWASRWGRWPALAAVALLLVALLLVACAGGDGSAVLRLTVSGNGVVRIDGVAAAAPLNRPFAPGTTVTLAALPADGERFVGWTGDLAGRESPVNLVMLGPRRVTATFEPIPPQYALVLSFIGDGGGRVVSDPAGVDCRASCATFVDGGRSITLTAEPDEGSFLLDWGACNAPGSPTCTLSLSANRSVGVVFTPIAAPAPNDAFASRSTLRGAAGAVNASNAAASSEPSEPVHAADAAGRSLWWAWVAPLTGRATFDASASRVAARVAAYTGSGLDDLAPAPSTVTTPAAGAEPGSPGAGASTLTFDTVADTTYLIAVDDADAAGGVIRLQWSAQGAVAWRAEPDRLTFLGERGQPAPPSRTLTLTHDGDVASAFTVSSDAGWLTVETPQPAPPSGEPTPIPIEPGASATLSVSVAACDSIGSDAGRLRIRGGGAEVSVEVTRTCSGADWQAEPAALAIVAGVAPGTASFERAVVLQNAGTASTFSVTIDAPWASVAPTAGSLGTGAERELTVSIDACVAVGTSTATLAVAGAGDALAIPVVRECRAAPPTVLSVDRVHLNQAVPAHDTAQDEARRIPIVAGRGGLLRVFVTASAPGALGASAELVLRGADGALERLTLDGPSEVPTETAEGSLATTFDVRLDASRLQPGFEAFVLVTAEDTGGRVEARFPAAGWWRPPVDTVPALPITLVPIALNGAAPPAVADPAAYLDLTERVYPLGDASIDVQVRQPLSFSGDLQALGEWDRLLRELTRARASDGGTRHYVGLVTPTLPSGPNGIAWLGRPGVGGFVPVAIARAPLPIGSWIVAHELGHNWGRGHAPCGGAPDPDPGYPYPDAGIGVWGYDLATDALRSPATATDLMSYCVATAWISDYTYRGVWAYRGGFGATPTQTPSTTPSIATGAAARSLVVSGSLDGAHFALDPIATLQAAPTATLPGPFTLIGHDAAGAEAFRVAFGTFETSQHRLEGFHLTVPLSHGVDIASVRIVRDGATLLERSAPLATTSAAAPTATRAGDGSVVVAWDTRAHAELVAFDGAGGALLGSDREGLLRVWPTGATLELGLSDGLRTTSITITAP